VGTDSFHTPPTLAASVVTELEKLAETFTPSPLSTFSGGVLVDRPYSGTMVPSQFYGLDPRVQSIMIEFNRSLYMDEETGEKLLSFHSMRGSLAEVLWVVAETWARG
jgi:N-formylglutamate deformylase